MVDDAGYKEFKDKLRNTGTAIVLLTGTDPDAKQALELGTMILLGTPLVVAADGGTPVPQGLRRIAKAVVSVDMKNEPERSAESIRVLTGLLR